MLLERFVGDCLPWEGPHTEAGKECVEEATTEMFDELAMPLFPISLCHVERGGREELWIKLISERRKKWVEGVLGLYLFLSIWSYLIANKCN